jgi:hypothetical protein
MRRFRFSFWKKLWRYFSIILIGYALHLPYYSLSKIINRATPDQLQSFYAVDVLQSIGAGLLVLFALRIIIRSDKVYLYSTIALLIIVMSVSPLFWKTDFSNYFHPLIANYFNRLNDSLFPVFPWINFILAGAIFARYFLDFVGKQKEEKFITGTAIIGLVMLLFGHFFYSGLFPAYLTSIIPNPVFFFERLGYIFVFASLCWYYNKWRMVRKSFVLDASRESLLIYWLHLIIIYGMFLGGKSSAILIGPTLNLLESIVATLILMLVMILVAKVWGWMKMKSPKYTGKVAWGVVGVLFIIFLLN